ncbi:putative 28S rRNA (cytosine-C(5))-methyltransferase [Aspergillus brasiliensis]|uniref:28S rRNA (Cytosine-C(5))-methyltransferase n=1 Tax=Aspergillus brasiliensis TaxID=319629 RepID=A0A9W5YU20_9EURO|nr:putative 28S rRNA (cytosine-C(5))-methyltransferase [Aspergillus brasiliensis]GKZ40953.1 putative 28S rRNA (cytosine-C(5))-methyltransferase [Aspergillus brasiliensis]
MSLYYDAVSILTAPSTTGGSFKSRIYNARNIKSAPAQIYALIIEASKWDILLKEVIEAAGILKLEPKLTPLLSLLLVHDHLLAKSGLAAKATHPLRQTIERHKTRLRGEFTKARVRRGCATIPELKDAISREKLALQGAQGITTAIYPRWVRVNNIRTTMEKQLSTTFAGYEQVSSLAELTLPKRMVLDPHVPDLIAVAPGAEFTSSPAYKNGEIILQDKASCFPAYLLVGDGEEGWDSRGELLDGCAAPGNKTTHMASLLAKQQHKPQQHKKGTRHGGENGTSYHIFSMDQSPIRAKTLQKMVSTAGADTMVTVLPGQDFLALDPTDPRFENVSGLLLDPSCSGSGIIGRDDVPKLTLPESTTSSSAGAGKKRKRRGNDNDDDDTRGGKKTPTTNTAESPSATDENDVPVNGMTEERLIKLSNLQTRIVEHALSFPAATRVTYSTCSIHLLENEAVVSRILASDVAKERGWRVLRRDEQPVGMRKWVHRGIREERGVGGGSATGGDRKQDGTKVEVTLSDEELEGCLRCWPGDEEGTGGFFVAGFVREEGAGEGSDDIKEDRNEVDEEVDEDEEEEEGGEDEWEGFSD